MSVYDLEFEPGVARTCLAKHHVTLPKPLMDDRGIKQFRLVRRHKAI